MVVAGKVRYYYKNLDMQYLYGYIYKLKMLDTFRTN